MSKWLSSIIKARGIAESSSSLLSTILWEVMWKRNRRIDRNGIYNQHPSQLTSLTSVASSMNVEMKSLSSPQKEKKGNKLIEKDCPPSLFHCPFQYQILINSFSLFCSCESLFDSLALFYFLYHYLYFQCWSPLYRELNEHAMKTYLKLFGL